MARGKQILENGEKLAPLATKVLPETKELLDALVKIKINGNNSVREVLEDMLKDYEAKHPEEFKQARDLAEMLKQKVYGRGPA